MSLPVFVVYYMTHGACTCIKTSVSSQIWSLVKKFYEDNIGTYPAYTNEATLDCMRRAHDTITAETWRNCCEHAEKIILEHAAEIAGSFTREPHPP